MAVVPVPTTGAISINDIKAAFPTINSNNLNSYKGKLWYKSDNSRGYFPSGDNAYISMSMFRDTREVSPVVAGSATYTSGTSITLPAMFNTLTVTVYGASGGGGGGSYLAGTTTYSGSSGGSGGNTSFGNSSDAHYKSASGGGGGGGGGSTYKSYLYGYLTADVSGAGSAGANGTPTNPDATGIATGGGGGSGSGDNQSHTIVTSKDQYGNRTSWTDYYASSGGSGGNGAKDYILAFDVNGSGGYDYIKNFYGASIPCSIGGAGSGGAGGQGLAGLRGGNGSGGKIVISWT